MNWIALIAGSLAVCVLLLVLFVPSWRQAFYAFARWPYLPLLSAAIAFILICWAIQSSGRRSSYLPVLIIAIVLPVLMCLLMPSLSTQARAAEATFLFGGLVAVSEVASRYKDEPIQACLSPYGVIYIILNGSISLAALVLILHFPGPFGAVSRDPILAAMTAGFGASAVMRTRLAILKGDDNKDVSIGPDYVIKILLSTIDKYVDRARAVRRQAIVVECLTDMRTLGAFRDAANYLTNSLLAFQNIDEALKKELISTLDDYDKAVLPADIKFLAMGFVFMNLVGEAHFRDVVANAKRIRVSVPGTNPTLLMPVATAQTANGSSGAVT